MDVAEVSAAVVDLVVRDSGDAEASVAIAVNIAAAVVVVVVNTVAVAVAGIITRRDPRNLPTPPLLLRSTWRKSYLPSRCARELYRPFNPRGP